MASHSRVRKETKTVPLDKVKWRKCLESKGITQERLSIEMGCHKNSIAADISSLGGDKIPLTVARFAEVAYGIKPEDYALQQEQETKTDPEEAVIPRLTQSQFEKSLLNVLGECQFVDYERLYKNIYSAVYEAVKKAWSE